MTKWYSYGISEYIYGRKTSEDDNDMDNILGFYTVRGYQLLEKNKKHLTPAMEDYLEMIYRNSLKEGYMRVNTLSGLLNVQAPSATKMVQRLTSLGMISYKRYGIIFLTEDGREIGKFLLERHEIVRRFLEFLGVEKENILKETELIEHNLSAGTLEKLDLLNRFMESGDNIIQSFNDFKRTLTVEQE